MKAESVLEVARTDAVVANKYVENALNFFMDNKGELFKEMEIMEKFQHNFEIESTAASHLLRSMTDDVVDPVTKVFAGGSKYVGILNYTEGEFYYGFEQFLINEDVRRVGVCSECVYKSERDREVSRAVEGQNVPFSNDWDLIRKKNTYSLP